MRDKVQKFAIDGDHTLRPDMDQGYVVKVEDHEAEVEQWKDWYQQASADQEHLEELLQAACHVIAGSRSYTGEIRDDLEEWLEEYEDEGEDRGC